MADGAPAKQLAGTDLRPEFIELGYDLFLDKNTLETEFVTGNILDPSDTGLVSLDARFDIIHVASFFHLFSWEDQLKVGVRLVGFLRPGTRALILGRQVGTRQPADSGEGSAVLRYLHNVQSFQALWDVIGEKTGTKWKVTGELFDSGFDDVPRVLFRFVIVGLQE